MPPSLRQQALCLAASPQGAGMAEHAECAPTWYAYPWVPQTPPEHVLWSSCCSQLAGVFQFRTKAESDATPVDWQQEQTTQNVSGLSSSTVQTGQQISD